MVSGCLRLTARSWNWPILRDGKYRVPERTNSGIPPRWPYHGRVGFLRAELVRDPVGEARGATRAGLCGGASCNPSAWVEGLMTARPRLALIVITLNEEQLICECLRSSSIF